MSPSISVIMLVYNSARHLKEAIDSILNQTFTDFELLIINDGSTDDSKAIILTYNDPRIRFFDDQVNKGISARSNQGLSLARGKYVGRMDSDDISQPQRLERQYQYLETHPDITVCGSAFNFIGHNPGDPPFNWVRYYEPAEIKINLLFDGTICNSTALIRASSLQQEQIKFDTGLIASEDYEFYVNISRHFKLVNLRDVLLQYRVSPHQISNTANQLQREKKFLIIRRQLSYLGIEPTGAEMRIHDSMFYAAPIVSFDYLPKIRKWIKKLCTANAKFKVYDEIVLASFLNELYVANQVALKRKLKTLSLKERLMYQLKCIIRWNSVR